MYAYQSWVMAIINDEKLEGEDILLPMRSLKTL